MPSSRRSVRAARRAGRRQALRRAVAALDGVDLDVRAGPSSGSSGRTAPARRRCSTPPPACSPSMPGRSLVAGSPAGSRAARAASALVPDEPAGFDELSVIGARLARPRPLGRRRAGDRSGGGARDGIRSRRPARPAARNALPRPAAAGERGCGALARAAADPRRRGDRNARPGGDRRPQRGRRDVGGARMRRPARHPGPALRGHRVPRDRVAPSRSRDRPRRARAPCGRGTAPPRSRRSSSRRSATVRFAKGSEMRSTLCEAVARCHLRRLRGVAAAAPLPAAIVALVVVTAPVVLFRLGGAVGAEVADSIGAAGVSDGLVLGPLLAAAVAGAALAVAAPPRSALGDQVAAGPAGRGDRRRGARARSRGCRLDRRRAVARCRLRRTRARASRRSCRPALRSLRRRSPPFPPAPSSPKAGSPPGAGSAAARSPSVSGAWAGSWWGSLSEPAPLGPLALVPPALRGTGSPGSRSACRVASGSGSLPPGSRSRRRARSHGHGGAAWGAPVDGACRLRLPRPCCSHGEAI